MFSSQHKPGNVLYNILVILWCYVLLQDEIWMPMCLQHGWFMPYTPASNEYGAWKSHYIACISTLNAMPDSKQVATE